MCACVEILSGFSVDLLTNFSFITNIKHFKGWNLITNICMHKHLCSLHTFYFLCVLYTRKFLQILHILALL